VRTGQPRGRRNVTGWSRPRQAGVVVRSAPPRPAWAIHAASSCPKLVVPAADPPPTRPDPTRPRPDPSPTTRSANCSSNALRSDETGSGTGCCHEGTEKTERRHSGNLNSILIRRWLDPRRPPTTSPGSGAAARPTGGRGPPRPRHLPPIPQRAPRRDHHAQNAGSSSSGHRRWTPAHAIAARSAA